MAPADLVERLFYGASLPFCLPACMAEPDSAETGAVLRSSLLPQYPTEAGFERVDVTDIDSPTWRFYLLH
jgi:hypothetical protein